MMWCALFGLPQNQVTDVIDIPVGGTKVKGSSPGRTDLLTSDTDNSQIVTDKISPSPRQTNMMPCGRKFNDIAFHFAQEISPSQCRSIGICWLGGRSIPMTVTVTETPTLRERGVRVGAWSVTGRYALVTTAKLLALGIGWLLIPTPAFLFQFGAIYVALLLTAWYGGTEPTAVATMLGAAGSCYLLLSARSSRDVAVPAWHRLW
jgi:hypothetical protein